jgi:hypothetical protein
VSGVGARSTETRSPQLASCSRLIFALCRTSTGKLRMEQHVLERACVRVRFGRVSSFSRVSRCSSLPGSRSTTSTGALLAAGTNANQRGLRHIILSVEHRFDALGVRWSVDRFHTLRFAAAVPEAALVIEITDVAHAVPSCAVSIRDLRVGVASIRVTYRGDACGPRTISSPISPGDNSSVSSIIAIGSSRDADDAPLDRVELAADADARAFVQCAAAVSPSTSAASIVATGRHSVAPKGVCIFAASWRTQASVSRSTSAGTGAPQENICRSDGIRAPVRAQCSPSTRHTAGDANACVTCQSFAAASSFARVGRRRARKVHFRQHGRHAHRRVEQREQRKARRDRRRPARCCTRDWISATCVSNMRCV